MSMTDDGNALSPQSAAEAIDELRSSGGLDALFAKIDAGELQLTGQGETAFSTWLDNNQQPNPAQKVA